jgi:hypothetical protein
LKAQNNFAYRTVPLTGGLRFAEKIYCGAEIPERLKLRFFKTEILPAVSKALSYQSRRFKNNDSSLKEYV